MPLPKDLSAPDKLIGDLEKASQVRKSFLSMSTLCSSQESVLKLKRDKVRRYICAFKYSNLNKDMIMAVVIAI